MSTMLRITQVGSPIGRTQDQRATVRSLGLRRIRHTVIQPDRPEIRGMLRKVAHLVTFEEIGTAEAEAHLAELEARRAPRPAVVGPRAKDQARAAAQARRKRPASTVAATPDVSSQADAKDDSSDAAPAAKKAPAKKAPAKKAAAKKAPAKKAAAKKAPAKKAAAKKSTKKSEG